MQMHKAGEAGHAPLYFRQRASFNTDLVKTPLVNACPTLFSTRGLGPREQTHRIFGSMGRHTGRPPTDKKTSKEKTARTHLRDLATTFLFASAVDAGAPAAARMAAPRACFWETVWPRLISANLWNRNALTKRHAPVPHCVPTANT